MNNAADKVDPNSYTYFKYSYNKWFGDGKFEEFRQQLHAFLDKHKCKTFKKYGRLLTDMTMEEPDFIEKFAKLFEGESIEFIEKCKTIHEIDNRKLFGYYISCVDDSMCKFPSKPEKIPFKTKVKRIYPEAFSYRIGACAGGGYHVTFSKEHSFLSRKPFSWDEVDVWKEAWEEILYQNHLKYKHLRKKKTS